MGLFAKKTISFGNTKRYGDKKEKKATKRTGLNRKINVRIVPIEMPKAIDRDFDTIYAANIENTTKMNTRLFLPISLYSLPHTA